MISGPHLRTGRSFVAASGMTEAMMSRRQRSSPSGPTATRSESGTPVAMDSNGAYGTEKSKRMSSNGVRCPPYSLGTGICST